MAILQLVLGLFVLSSATAFIAGSNSESNLNSTAAETLEMSRANPFLHCYDHLTPDHFVKEKNGIVEKYFRWPKATIPYVVDAAVSAENKKIIMAGIAKVEKGTCLKFVERTTEQNYAVIETPDAPGCYATGVGMRGGPQFIRLQKVVCSEDWAVAHELLHTAGLWHEQSRPDRDQYIEVLDKNIQPAMLSEYGKCDDKKPVELEDACSTFDIPYDVNSIMHYASMGGSAAINPKEPVMKSKPGVAPISKSSLTEVTENDRKKIAAMYGC